MITDKIKAKIQSVVSVFETSSLTPRYDILVVLNDGPGGSYQITYGKHQTTESGGLKTLLTMYCNEGGRYAHDLRSYLDHIGRTPLYANVAFKQLLKLAGTDPVMHTCQDIFFDRHYWTPAYHFFEANGFTLPLSMLVIYDSYIHSGGVPSWLRDDFREVPPARGGNEKKWVAAYVATRDYWLEHHPSKILRGTDYRTDTLLDCICRDNWTLQKKVVCQFNEPDNPKAWITIP